MLRKTLLATTALVLCASLAYAGQKASQVNDLNWRTHSRAGLPIHSVHHIVGGIPVGMAGIPVRKNIPNYETNATFNNFSKDANAQFISWYGYLTAGNYYSCASVDYCDWLTASNAISITGTGAAVTRIKVPIVSYTGPSTEFNVGIYSATASGLPGSQELAGGSAAASDTRYCCTAVRAVKVNITLNPGKKYFLEVTCKSDNCEGAWNMEDTDFSGEAKDYFRYKAYVSSFSKYTISSPWHQSTYYHTPGQPAAIVK